MDAEQHAKAILDAIRKGACRHFDADDVAQSVWLKLRSNARFAGLPFDAQCKYAYRSGQYAALDSHRHSQTKKSLSAACHGNANELEAYVERNESNGNPPVLPDPHDPLDWFFDLGHMGRMFALDKLHDAISMLPDKSDRQFVRAYLRTKCAKTAAERKQYSRCIAELRKITAELESEPDDLDVDAEDENLTDAEIAAEEQWDREMDAERAAEDQKDLEAFAPPVWLKEWLQDPTV